MFERLVVANSLMVDSMQLARMLLSCILKALVDGQAHERFDNGVGCLVVRVDDRVVVGIAWLGRKLPSTLPGLQSLALIRSMFDVEDAAVADAVAGLEPRRFAELRFFGY